MRGIHRLSTKLVLHLCQFPQYLSVIADTGLDLATPAINGGVAAERGAAEMQKSGDLSAHMQVALRLRLLPLSLLYATWIHARNGLYD